MADFDPSVISSIPDYAPHPVEAQQRGLTLANHYQQNEAGKIDLANKRQDQSDEAKERALLGKADLSTFEGRTAAAEGLTKINPKRGLDFMGKVGQLRNQDTEFSMQKLQMAAEQQEQIVGALDPIVAQLDEAAKMPGATPAMLDAKAKQLVIPAIMQFQKSRPDLAPMLDKFLQEPNNLTYQGVRSADLQSKRGAAAIKARLDDEKERERERHARAVEGLGYRKEEHKEAVDATGNLTDDAVETAARRIAGGEPARDVLANFGRGAQGPGNIAKVQNRVAALLKGDGASPEELTRRNLEFKGAAKEEQTSAAIAGKIRYAEKEIQQIAPKVLELSKKVPRGEFVPWNRLSQYTDAQTSNPDLKRLKAYLTTMTNSYDTLAARGGTDVEKRAHNRELLNAADSPEALEAAVQTIVEEARLSGVAASQSMKLDRPTGEQPVGSSPGPGAVRPGTPPPAGGAAPGSVGSAPTGAGPAEKTAVNPTTGEVLVLRGGKWVPRGG